MATTYGRTAPTTSGMATEARSQAATRAASTPAGIVWGITRISVGFVFLWAFLDKLFGLGFATPAAKSWLNGGSPTAGFLMGSSDGPMGGLFSALAGQAWVDWLFMLGLLGIGSALMLGIGMRIAAASGTVMLLMMYAAVMPVTSNPFLDQHLIYAMVLIGLALGLAGDTLGLGKWWASTSLVKRFPVLR